LLHNTYLLLDLDYYGHPGTASGNKISLKGDGTIVKAGAIKPPWHWFTPQREGEKEGGRFDLEMVLFRTAAPDQVDRALADDDFIKIKLSSYSPLDRRLPWQPADVS
jgi:hypothetical protein